MNIYLTETRSYHFSCYAWISTISRQGGCEVRLGIGSLYLQKLNLFDYWLSLLRIISILFLDIQWKGILLFFLQTDRRPCVVPEVGHTDTGEGVLYFIRRKHNLFWTPSLILPYVWSVYQASCSSSKTSSFLCGSEGTDNGDAVPCNKNVEK